MLWHVFGTLIGCYQSIWVHRWSRAVAYALDRLIDSTELSAFEKQYSNDEDGAAAIAPAVLLKAILLGC